MAPLPECSPADMTAARPSNPWPGRAIAALAALALLWLSFNLYRQGQPMWALGVLTLGAAALYVYATAQSLAWRYLFPGVAAMAVFVAFPLLYTVQMGFTNYSSAHLLSEDRARAYLLDQQEIEELAAHPITTPSESPQRAAAGLAAE